MPVGAVKPGQEAKWEAAKKAAHEQYPKLSEDDDRFWKICMSIFKRMTGDTEKSQGVFLRRRVAWRRA